MFWRSSTVNTTFITCCHLTPLTGVDCIIWYPTNVSWSTGLCMPIACVTWSQASHVRCSTGQNYDHQHAAPGLGKLIKDLRHRLSLSADHKQIKRRRTTTTHLGARVLAELRRLERCKLVAVATGSYTALHTTRPTHRPVAVGMFGVYSWHQF